MTKSSKKILVATNNKNKIKEIAKILEGTKIEPVSLAELEERPPDVVEDGATFEENAEKKAREMANMFNMLTMADDSGICVDALDGGPGVLSARYGPEGLDDRSRYLHLLEEIKGVPDHNRQARFVCVICLAEPNGQALFFRGECEGIITREPQGEGGFGYDPIFYHEPSKKTFGQMSQEEKNKVSHRAEALKKLKEFFLRNPSTRLS